ncbi:MAG: hypothetical protein F6K00_31550 [Leptolyngbya sp. SIOISBB]|nr:hypothetical protein [Leptolyngbya sp. SIOISBB]
MSFLNKVGEALSSFIHKPVDAVCDWITAPLKAAEHERREQSQAAAHERAIAIQESRIRTDSITSIREREAESELEVKRIRDINITIAEIDEWKKDKALQRMQQTAEAVISYQERLTNLNVSAIEAIGSMQLELRERAQKLVYDKTLQYKELQTIAINEAMSDFKRIDEQFSDNEQAKDILYKAVDRKLANIFKTADSFLVELNEDIKSLNKSISLLAERGQNFIENHLDRLTILPNENLLLSSQDQENLERPRFGDRQKLPSLRKEKS